MLDDFSARPSGKGQFAVDGLLLALKSNPNVVVLPAEYAVRAKQDGPKEVFVVCSTPEQASRVKASTIAGNSLDPFIGSIAILEITPWCASVYQPAPEGVVAQVEALLLPVLRAQPIRVFSEEGEEPDCAREPSQLFR